MKQAFKGFSLALISMFASIAAFAQVTTASIAGHVADNEGAVVGAPVVAVYTPTGASYYSVTDARGNYRINGLVPGGPYTVSIEMLGYRKVEHVGVYAPLGEVVTVNSELQEEALGLEAAIFIADSNESGMNIKRSGIGTSVSQRTITALPTTSRSLNDVMKLSPQASLTSNGLAVGGGNYRSSYVTIDGAAFNNAFGIGSNLPAGSSPISLDAIEQMSVNITPFDVRQSGFTGGAINAVTKSGTNEWSASVYNYFNNDQLIGDRVEDNRLSLNKSLYNTVGFTLGGPIVKNKLFFFVNAEYSFDTSPGPIYTVREKDSDSFGGTVVRPTRAFMENVKKYLDDKYKYDPGRYQGYSLDTPDWKIMARLDWNINDVNKLTLRASHTKNYYSASPSNSINPLASSVYDRNNYGRTSIYAQYFESQRYFQEQNFTSFAAELNSNLFNGSALNLFRVTWSHQNEPRSWVGKEFPTVDILENYTDNQGNDHKAVLTSFGLDPFTFGNLREVHTVVATDELSWTKGINNFVAGLQFEFDNTKNGYMQGGLGYYVYNSWEDFVNDAKPAAFAITHSNRDDLAQVYPSFNYMQASAYLQDELNFSDNFKLTAGLRFEMPFYPSIAGNENAEFLDLAKANAGSSIAGLSTADMPKARLNISPRIGFNWDILGNRDLILRGGSGIYTGRIPFVWIVSAVGNSNNIQAQYIDSDGTNPMTPHFHDNVKDILNELYGGSFKKQNLPAPTATTIMDKELRMPTTWKSSLALESYLPGGVKATLEGIYNKDLSTVQVKKLGIKQGDGIQLPGEPGKRVNWVSEGIKNSQKGNVTPYYLTNSDVNGYYYSVTARLEKDFNFGLSLMAAYTYSDSKSITEGWGDQVSSAFTGMNYGKNGSNVAELGHSAYVSPNRLIANVSYRIDEGKGATTIGLFYEGFNHFYVGNYSYTRYSYTISNVTGDGGANNLMYIPTDSELGQMTFANDAQKAAFKEFIEGDRYLSSHRGQYSERGALVAPWMNRFNFKVSQDIRFDCAGKPTTLQIGLDINNVANLLNSNWGLAKRISADNVLSHKDGVYSFTQPTWSKYAGTYNTWEMLLSARLFF